MRRLFTILLLLSVIGIGPLGCTPAAEPPVPPDMDTMDAGAKEVIERELTMVRANPSHAPAWMQLGRVYIAHQIPAAAATCFLHVSGITPSPEADYLHAVALDALGDVAGRRQAHTSSLFHEVAVTVQNVPESVIVPVNKPVIFVNQSV